MPSPGDSLMLTLVIFADFYANPFIRQKIREMYGHEDRIHTALFLDASTIISGSADATVRIWDVDSGSCRFTCKGHSSRVSSLAICGNMILSGGDDRTVRMWDYTTGQCIRILESDSEGSFTRFAFNDDKTRLAVAVFGGERTMDIWSILDGYINYFPLIARRKLRSRRTYIAACRYHTRSITQMANRNGNLVTSGADGKICTWSWKDGTLMRVLEDGHECRIPSAEKARKILPAFNACPMPNNPPKGIRGLIWSGKYMISGGLDGVLRVWNEDLNEVQAERMTEGDPGRIRHLVSGPGNAAAISSFGPDVPFLLEVWDSEELENGNF